MTAREGLVPCQHSEVLRTVRERAFLHSMVTVNLFEVKLVGTGLTGDPALLIPYFFNIFPNSLFPIPPGHPQLDQYQLVLFVQIVSCTPIQRAEQRSARSLL